MDEIWDLIESVSEGFPTYSSYEFPYKIEHRLFTGKVTSHVLNYLITCLAKGIIGKMAGKSIMINYMRREGRYFMKNI